ncbi:heavy-metal-associated domain-containing protein [Mariniphaga sediminis]|uniref:heavy-metal-associated domain-containing protein n=1 Tax=Mariniphaga sediminis TaxID=1628158 RepID=UPI0035666756
MKQVSILFFILLVGAFANEAFAQKKDMAVACFKSSMDCANCESTLTEYLKFEKGVKDLKVDHASNTILIEYKANKNTEKDLAKAIEKKGYKAEKISKAKYDEIVTASKKQGQGHSH